MANKIFHPAVGIDFLRTEEVKVHAEKKVVSMDSLLSGNKEDLVDFSPSLGSSAFCSQLCAALGAPGMQENLMKLVKDEVNKVGHYKFKVIASSDAVENEVKPNIKRHKSTRERFQAKFLSSERPSVRPGVRNVKI